MRAREIIFGPAHYDCQEALFPSSLAYLRKPVRFFKLSVQPNSTVVSPYHEFTNLSQARTVNNEQRFEATT